MFSKFPNIQLDPSPLLTRLRPDFPSAVWVGVIGLESSKTDNLLLEDGTEFLLSEMVQSAGAAASVASGTSP